MPEYDDNRTWLATMVNINAMSIARNKEVEEAIVVRR